MQSLLVSYLYRPLSLLNPDASPRGGLTRAPRLGGSGSERLGGHESLDTSPAQIYATST